MNFISSLLTAVTAYGNGRFVAKANPSRLGCGMVRLEGRPCGWQNRTPRVYGAFGIEQESDA